MAREKRSKFDIELFYHLLTQFIDDLEEETDYPNHYYQSLMDGEQNLDNKQLLTIKKFDGSWIRIVESYFHSIDKIIRNLKSILRYDEETVIIEKAKKTDSQTVRHLAANSHLIREIKPNNEVVPEKVLIKQAEIEYGIYENRFVKTLINKLSHFVDSRVRELRSAVLARQENKITYGSNFNYSEAVYDINVSITETNFTDGGNVEKHNANLLQRAERLNELVNKLRISSFMKQMANYKDVRSPIMKTQIILKNPDYKNCYMLWLFIEQQQNEVNYEEINSESMIPLSPLFKKSLNQAVMYLLSGFYNASLSKEEVLKKLKGKKFKYTRPEIERDTNLEIDLSSDKVINNLELNEYFLNKMEQILLQKTNQLVSNEVPTKTGLKQALTDLTEITNAVYQKYFDLPKETSLFSRMVKSDDIGTRFNEISEKINTLNIVNQVKYTDYRSNVTLVNDYYRELNNLEKEIFKSKRISTRNAITEEMKKEFKHNKLKIDKIVAKVRNDQKQLIKSERKELMNLRKEVNNLVKLRSRELQKLEQQQKKRLEKANQTKLTKLQTEQVRKVNLETNQKIKEINKDITILKNALEKTNNK